MQTLIADADTLEQDIALKERVFKLQSEEDSNGRPPRAQPGDIATAERKEEQRRKFVN